MQIASASGDLLVTLLKPSASGNASLLHSMFLGGCSYDQGAT